MATDAIAAVVSDVRRYIDRMQSEYRSLIYPSAATAAD